MDPGTECGLDFSTTDAPQLAPYRAQGETDERAALSLQEQLRRLNKENDQLRNEGEILVKAPPFFAEERR
jgi:transposase-like protein